MTRRGSRGPPRAPEALVREPWLIAILLAERLPVGGVDTVSLTTCATLAEKFVVEQATEIASAISAAKAKLGVGADLDDHADAVLSVLIPWARGSSGIRFQTSPPPPYR